MFSPQYSLPAGRYRGESHEQAEQRATGLLTRLAEYLQHPENSVQGFFHNKFPQAPSLLQEAMLEAKLPARLACRVGACSSKVFMYRHKFRDTIRYQYNSCGNRWCPHCARRTISRTKKRALTRITGPRRFLSFLTLTLAQIPGEPYAQALDRLRKGFTKLRRDPWFAGRVKGGLYAIETVPSKTYDMTLHVHLHCIMEAAFLPFWTLRNKWKEHCERAGGVDIKRCKEQERAQAYIASYLSKPVPDKLFEKPELLKSAVASLRQHRRLFAYFGEWRQRDQDKKSQHEKSRLAMQESPTEFEQIGDFADILESAANDEEYSLGIIDKAKIPRRVLPNHLFLRRYAWINDPPHTRFNSASSPSASPSKEESVGLFGDSSQIGSPNLSPWKPFATDSPPRAGPRQASATSKTRWRSRNRT